MINKEMSALNRNNLFEYYKSFVGSIMDTLEDQAQNNHILYGINISYDTLADNVVLFSISIRDTRYDRLDKEKMLMNGMYNKFFELNNQVILTGEDAKELVDDIRNDFEVNHYITYSSVNVGKKIQTLKNSHFVLCISLRNDEIEEAMEFNSKVNNNDRHPTRTRALTF